MTFCIRYVRLKAADGDADVKKPKLTFSNLVQLVLMGAGAPGYRTKYIFK